jgi:hypothetical protein
MSISDINKGASGVNPTADSILPNQTGNSGKVLKTDGVNASWDVYSPSPATESVAGIAKVSTVAQAEAATDNESFITPLKQRIVQIVHTQTGAVASSASDIPNDNTIPQITEGAEYMTLAITPKSATNKLLINVVFQFSTNIAEGVTAALFQDSTVDALAASQGAATAGTVECHPIVFNHYMTAGTTNATTFRVRAGGTVGSGGIITFNGTGSARKLGGVMSSSITITEIKS